MNCQQLTDIIHPYLDRELDLARSLKIEQHLKECAPCARTCQQQQRLHSAMTGTSLYFEAPKRLQKNVRLAVREASKATPAQATRASPAWSVRT